MNRFEAGFPGEDNTSIWVNYRLGRIGVQLRGKPPLFLRPSKARELADLLERGFDEDMVPIGFDDPQDVVDTLRKCADEAEKGGV